MAGHGSIRNIFAKCIMCIASGRMQQARIRELPSASRKTSMKKGVSMAFHASPGDVFATTPGDFH